MGLHGPRPKGDCVIAVAQDDGITRVCKWLLVTRLIPICPDHKVAMVQYSGGQGGPMRYYACPVHGCPCTGKGRTTRQERE